MGLLNRIFGRSAQERAATQIESSTDDVVQGDEADALKMGKSSRFQTPMRPEDATVDPVARAVGETPADVRPSPDTGSVVGDGVTESLIERKGIIDESRHTGSMGRR